MTTVVTDKNITFTYHKIRICCSPVYSLSLFKNIHTNNFAFIVFE